MTSHTAVHCGLVTSSSITNIQTTSSCRRARRCLERVRTRASHHATEWRHRCCCCLTRPCRTARPSSASVMLTTRTSCCRSRRRRHATAAPPQAARLPHLLTVGGENWLARRAPHGSCDAHATAGSSLLNLSSMSASSAASLDLAMAAPSPSAVPTCLHGQVDGEVFWGPVKVRLQISTVSAQS
jgi:hypothetical protein